MTTAGVCGRPVSTASAPGRICLAGESLDWMVGGPSVTVAIPLRTRVTAWRVEGPNGLVISSGAPIYRTRFVPARAAAAGPYRGEVLDHLQASARLSIGDPAQLAGLVLHAQTELPVAAGLASSAAVTLSACAAMASLDGAEFADLEQLSSIAHRIEAEELDIGAGWTDHLACAHGGVNAIDGSDSPRATRIADALRTPIVLVDTLERRSTKSVLAERRAQLLAKDPAMMTYVARTTELVSEIIDELTAADVDYQALGARLTTAHDLLARQARCSTPLIDTCIERVLAAGAYGAKLTGSGHGGCLFALVSEDALVKVLTAVQGLPVHALALPATATPGVMSETAAIPGPVLCGPDHQVDRPEREASVEKSADRCGGSSTIPSPEAKRSGKRWRPT